jgi:hypothetical protein
MIASHTTLFDTGEVYAQQSTTPWAKTDGAWVNQDDASKTELSIVIWLETILRVIYLIMWPLLALAGAAMDNSLVYGKIFNFTPALWRFRTIMRNLANFAIGLLFLWAIFRTIFTQWSTSDLFDALKKLVLWAILVQISWFALSVLIDLSTVATAAIGWLPLYAAKDSEEYKQIRYLKPYGIFQMDKTANELATEAEHTVFYGCEGSIDKQFYIPCMVDNGVLAPKQSFVLQDPETRQAWKQQFVNSRKNHPIDEWLYPLKETRYLTLDTISDDYCVRWNSLIFYEENKPLTEENLTKADKSWLRDKWVQQMMDQECLTLDTIIQNSKWLSGPLYTLYASLLNTAELGLSTNHKNVADLSLEFLMRTVMAILLFIPLLVFAIIMIIRVAVLWLVIAASPILVLMFINKWKAPGSNKVASNIANLSNILSLIFLPVIGTFAITMSVVFLSLIQRANFMRDVTIAELFGLETASTASSSTDANQKCYDLKITQLCFNESQRNAGNNIIDTFGYLLINGFGLVLMWTVVFAALKSSEITKWVVDTVQKFSEDMLAAAPIIPTWYGMTSKNNIMKAKNDLLSLPSEYNNAQYQKQFWDQMNAIRNSDTISELKNGAQQVRTTWTQQDAKSFITWSWTTWLSQSHKDVDGFFDILHKGSWATWAPATNFAQAFTNDSNYTAYKGIDGMQSIYKNWNGYNTNSDSWKKHNKEIGDEMKAALNARPSIKKFVRNSKEYFFDTSMKQFAIFDNAKNTSNEYFTSAVLPMELASGNFANQEDASNFVNLINIEFQWPVNAKDVLDQIYPQTHTKLKTAVTNTPSVQKYNLGWYHVNLESVNGAVTSITKSET